MMRTRTMKTRDAVLVLFAVALALGGCRVEPGGPAVEAAGARGTTSGVLVEPARGAGASRAAEAVRQPEGAPPPAMMLREIESCPVSFTGPTDVAYGGMHPLTYHVVLDAALEQDLEFTIDYTVVEPANTPLSTVLQNYPKVVQCGELMDTFSFSIQPKVPPALTTYRVKMTITCAQQSIEVMLKITPN